MSINITQNIFIGFVVAGESTNEVFEQWELESNHRPRFGRNWWFWFPNIKTNGGRFRSWEATDINLHWLCFCLYLTVYPRRNNKCL